MCRAVAPRIGAETHSRATTWRTGRLDRLDVFKFEFYAGRQTIGPLVFLGHHWSKGPVLG